MLTAAPHSYKRDQVERSCAISLNLWDGSKGEPSPRLRIELKRLLVLDRKLGADLHPKVPVRYAFHEAPPPGRGTDVEYGVYDAFALLIGVQLLRSNIAQSRCVEFMRNIRSSLEVALRRILQTQPSDLRPELTETERGRRLADGLLIDDIEHMLFLAAAAGDKLASNSRYDDGIESSANICDHKGLLEQLRGASQWCHSLIVIELVNAAQRLRYFLERAPSRPRGRS